MAIHNDLHIHIVFIIKVIKRNKILFKYTSTKKCVVITCILKTKKENIKSNPSSMRNKYYLNS